jgi:alginate O-acetyltransferase complex protein AlgI
LVGWVFFRAADLQQAVTYLLSMFGFGNAGPNAILLRGILYKPYYLLSIATAALIVWAGTQSWDWTQRMTPTKTAISFAVGWIALAVLTAQESNPFIYFVF